jgi:ATP-binding cassette subfamily B protein
MADHVYVLDQGAVIEHGTHPELMRADGAYAPAYRLQAAGYRAE